MEAFNRLMMYVTLFSGFVRQVCLMTPGNCGQWKAHVEWKRSHSLSYSSYSNGCSRGARYITTYNISNSTYHIAAILCSNDRYKLLMKDPADKDRKYRDISDLLGEGQDHCELVGMDEEYLANVKIGNTLENKDADRIAYSRSRWHQRFEKRWVNVDKIPEWYECGISIPSSRKSYTQKDVHIKEKEQVNDGCRLDKDQKDTKDNISQWDTIHMLFTYSGWCVFGLVFSSLCLCIGIYFHICKPCMKLTCWNQCKTRTSCPETPRHTRHAELPPFGSLLSAFSSHSSPEPYLLPFTSNAPQAQEAPSASIRDPPWVESLPLPPAVPWSGGFHDEGLPTYEEAANYPLVGTAAEDHAEPPPPTYDDAALLDVKFTCI